jgi:hypothetical protein
MATPSNNIAVVLVDSSRVNIYSRKQPIIYLPLTYEEIGVFSNDPKKLLYLRFNSLPWTFRIVFSRFRNFEDYFTFWSLLNSERSYKWLKKYNEGMILNNGFNEILSPAHYLLSQCLSQEEIKLQLHM